MYLLSAPSITQALLNAHLYKNILNLKCFSDLNQIKNYFLNSRTNT